MLETEYIATCDAIRRIRFRQDISKVAKIVNENFQPVLFAQGIDAQEYVKLVTKPHVIFALSSLHPFLSRFFEVFVLIHEHELIGTGTVQRVHLGNKTRWLLCNFAVTRSLHVTRHIVLKMITLMRKTIEHACSNGAIEISAYVREDNRTVLAICKDEGFEIMEEYSHYLVHPALIQTIQQATSSCQEMTLRKLNLNATDTLAWFITRRIVGLHKSVFVAKLKDNPVAEIEVLTRPGFSSSHELNIRPLCDITPILAFAIVANALGVVHCERQSASIIFPARCGSLIQIMKQYNISEVFRREHLLFRTKQASSLSIDC